MTSWVDPAGLAWDSIALYKLQHLFPVLVTVRIRCPVREMLGPVGCPQMGAYCLADTIAHLNDFHGWPRVEKDRTADNQHQPTIMDWLKETAEENEWDLTMREST